MAAAGRRRTLGGAPSRILAAAAPSAARAVRQECRERRHGCESHAPAQGAHAAQNAVRMPRLMTHAQPTVEVLRHPLLQRATSQRFLPLRCLPTPARFMFQSRARSRCAMETRRAMKIEGATHTTRRKRGDAARYARPEKCRTDSRDRWRRNVRSCQSRPPSRASHRYASRYQPWPVAGGHQASAAALPAKYKGKRQRQPARRFFGTFRSAVSIRPAHARPSPSPAATGSQRQER